MEDPVPISDSFEEKQTTQMQQLHIETYPMDEYKSVIIKAPAQYGVRWVLKDRRERPLRIYKENDNSNKTTRKSSVLWSERYICHRSGKPEKKRGRVIGGQSGKTRVMRKKSKKVHCPARLSVTCFTDNPRQVVLKYVGEHCNHLPGSIEDLQYLPNTEVTRAKRKIDAAEV